ncbi:MAG: helix-turn-helix domain-containing protein [Oscillospiraceae bacterium]|nr:helix-turn-helix domain-containing protein [Oscillospiraceae bacterium]
MIFYEQVRYVREVLMLTQAQLAIALNVTESTIRRWEQGKTIPHSSGRRRFYAFCEENKKKLGSLEKALPQSVNRHQNNYI